MEKGNRGNSRQGLKRRGNQGQQSKGANFQFPSFLNQYGGLKKYATEKNVYMALGIATAVGGLTYLAFKYIPWDSIKEKIEEELDSVQKGEFTPETVDAL